MTTLITEARIANSFLKKIILIVDFQSLSTNLLTILKSSLGRKVSLLTARNRNFTRR